jgi:hypothetical protein
MMFDFGIVHVEPWFSTIGPEGERVWLVTLKEREPRPIYPAFTFWGPPFALVIA